MTKLKLEDRRWPWLSTLAILAVSLLVLCPVIFGGRFFWDDYVLILDNPAIRSSSGLHTIWFTRQLPDYFPLTSTLFWLEWRLFSDAAPGGYHLVNALLHGASALLLWQVLKTLRIPGALFAALLFAVHPVNTESAAWIAEGKNTLSVCLMLAALLLWAKSERRSDFRLYAGSLALFLLALLAKTGVVMLPVALLAILWYRRRLTLPAFLRTLPFFALSLILGLVTMWFQANRSIADVPIRSDGFASRLATAGYAVWFYLLKALFPVGITFAYPRWEAAKYGAAAFIPLALLLLLFVVLFVLRNKIGRGWFAALVAYVAMLLPILGFINVFFMRYSLVSNHWQYPAIPAFCAAAGAFVIWLARNARSRQAAVLRWNIVTGAALALLALLAIDAATIAAVYRTEQGVWEDVLVHDPDNWLAHSRLGELAMQRARTAPEAAAEAAVHLRKVVDLHPELVVGYTELANAYIAMGRIPEARQLLEKAVDAPVGSRRERGLAHVNRGSLLGTLGDPAGAEREFAQAVRVNPKSTIGWLHLGMMRALRGDFAAARDAFEKSAAADPTFVDPQLQLALLAMRTGDRAAAQRALDAALAIDPGNAQALQLRAQLDVPPASNVSQAASTSATAPVDSPIAP
jgi:tetratricopeptide (TPR) repeat protein